MKPSPEVVLAVDFSLDRLDVALSDSQQEWLWPHRAYPNNWPGFQALKQDLLTELGEQGAVHLTATGESTGPYWWHLFYHLSHDQELAFYEPELALLNPAQVKRFRRALSEQDKTDLDDPHLIELYYRAVGVKHLYQFNLRYLPLRFLSRAYARLIHTLTAEKAYFQAILYLLTSEYPRLKPFSNLFGVTSLQLLEDCPDFQTIAAIPPDTLADQLQAVAKGTLPDPDHNAHKLHQVAADTYPLPPVLAASLHLILQQTLAHIRFLTDNQKAYQLLIKQELGRLPEAQLALEHPGLGPILVAGFLSEIQDTHRFITGLKFDHKIKDYRPRNYDDGQAGVAKLAGLWWPKHDSGRFQAKSRHLARERNPYLRFWFVQAAYTLTRHDPDYTAYYQRKYSESSHHHHQRALVLTARKAVRMVFALLYKGQRACLEEAAST